MALDHLELEPRPPRSPGHGRVVVAGVVGACALGVGLGLWARPTVPTDNIPAPAEPVAAEARRAALQIVIDDEPAPLGEPLEVLPPDARRHNLAPFGARPEPIVPRRPASGLVKVDAPTTAEPLPVIRLEPPPKPEAPTAPPPQPKTADKASKAEPAREVRAEKKSPKAERRVEQEKGAAKLVKVRAEKAEKSDKKSDKSKAVAEKRRPELKKLVKVVKAAPKAIGVKAKAVVRKEPKAELAEAKPKAKKADAGKVKLAKAKPAPPKPVRSRSKPEPVRAQVQKKPVPKGEGPMRVAKAPNRCANADPGEALVCSDGRLSVRDRQLQQAYRNAEAAGVPTSALQRQQARWLQARAAAARQAPWAVEDVYVARIAELNDLTRDAREN